VHDESTCLTSDTIGSVVLGFVLYEAMYTDILATRTRLIGATGFLSSFTTYSTFALQTTLTATPLWAMVNIIATYVLGFSGVLLGRAGARAVEGVRNESIA
jgi:CrcB protein